MKIGACLATDVACIMFLLDDGLDDGLTGATFDLTSLTLTCQFDVEEAMLDVPLDVPIIIAFALGRGEMRPACATRTFSATHPRCLTVLTGTFCFFGDGGIGSFRGCANGPLKRAPCL